MKLKILLILAALTCVAHAGGNLQQETACHWTVITANGQQVSIPWLNPDGVTIYIKRIEVYYNVAGWAPIGAVYRKSDGSELVYISGSSPLDENYSPDYFTLDSTDSLILSFTANGRGEQEGIAYWVWYTLQP